MAVNRGDVIRVVNDTGAGHKTRILDREGRDITLDLSVRSIALKLDVGEIVTADLEVVAPHVDIQARIGSITAPCPYCGHDQMEDE